MSLTQEFTSDHVLEDGKPAGGETSLYIPAVSPTQDNERVLYLRWQNGPLGSPDDPERAQPNGIFVETVIAAAIDRIEFYERAGFGCPENRTALEHLYDALAYLNERTARRTAQNVEGTHQRGEGDDQFPLHGEENHPSEADSED